MKLEASITSQTKTYNSFLQELRCRKEKEAPSNSKSPVELSSYGHLVTEQLERALFQNSTLPEDQNNLEEQIQNVCWSNRSVFSSF